MVQAVGDALKHLYLLCDLIYGLVRVVRSNLHRADVHESSLMSRQAAVLTVSARRAQRSTWIILLISDRAQVGDCACLVSR